MTLRMLLWTPLPALALAAAVLATSASANSDIHFLNEDESPITTPVTVHLTGPGWFENEWGGLACSEMTATIEFKTSNAAITQAGGLNCATTGVLKAIGCEFTSPSAPVSTGLPWGLTPESLSAASLSGLAADLPLQAGCPIGSAIFIVGNGVRINAVNEGEIGDVTLTGNLSTTIGEFDVDGELSPTPDEPTILLAET